MVTNINTNLAEFCEANLKDWFKSIQGDRLIPFHNELQNLPEFKNTRLKLISKPNLTIGKGSVVINTINYKFNKEFLGELQSNNTCYLYSIGCLEPYEDQDGNIVRDFQLRCWLGNERNEIRYTASFPNDCVYSAHNRTVKFQIDTKDMDERDIESALYGYQNKVQALEPLKGLFASTTNDSNTINQCTLNDATIRTIVNKLVAALEVRNNDCMDELTNKL